MRRAAWLMVWGVFGGCSPDGLTVGLSGCGEVVEAPFVSTEPNTVPTGVTGAFTAAGTRFLVERRELIAGLLFDVGADGWVRLTLPPLDFGDPGGGLGLGIRDVVVRFDLRAVDLGLAFVEDDAGEALIRLSVGGARLALDDGIVAITVGGDAACRLGNGLDPGTAHAALVEADFSVDLYLTIDEEGRLRPRVVVPPFHIQRLGFSLIYDRELPECADGVTSTECRVVCGVGDIASELVTTLYELLQERINELLAPFLTRLVNAIADRLTEKPLAVEGALHPRIASALLPTATDAHPIGFRVAPSPGGFHVRPGEGDGDGVGLHLDVGLDGVPHPCVPPVTREPGFSAGPPPALTGYDHAGAPYHLGLALSAAAVNRAVWVAYRGGTLCIALDSDQIAGLLGQRVDTDTLALILPGIRDLTRGPRPILLALDPAFDADDFPLAHFFPVPDAGGLPQAGLALNLPNLGLSFYALVEERWTRLLQARFSVRLDLSVQATPDDSLTLAVGTPTLTDLRQEYNELLDGAQVPALLELVSDLLAAGIVSDTLKFEIGFGGLLSELTGLPLDARVAALRVEGERADFLSVLVSLVPVAPGRGLTAATRTSARLLGADPAAGWVHLAVGAELGNAPVAARYQWRVDGGPWRPLVPASDGELALEEPRLRVLGPHTLEVRAVAEGDYRTLDPVGVRLDLRTEAPAAQPPAEPSADSPAPAWGCVVSAPGREAPAGLWALFVALALGMWRRRALALIAPLALILPWLAGCEDRRPAAETGCTTTAECPGGLHCLDGRCERAMACQTTEDCCPGAECRGGVCLARDPVCEADIDCPDPVYACQDGVCLRRTCAEGCADARGAALGACVGEHCHREPPCRGRCGGGTVCFPATDHCGPRPPTCGEGCPDGQVQVVLDSAAHLGPRCDLSAARCECVAAPPLVPADVGRHASMAVVRNEPVFAAYDADYGDLVYVEGVEAGAARVTYLDGVPDGVAPRADPTGPRGGVTEPGPDRGRYARLLVDAKGRRHVVYYDATAGALRYIRGDDDGTWSPPLVIDDAGDAGRYPRIAVDGAGALHVVYHFFSPVDRLAGLRYAYAPTGEPGPGAFEVWTVSQRALAADAPDPAPPGETPAAHGVMPCLRVAVDGRARLAFYDGAERWLYLAEGEARTGFAVHRLTPTLAPDFPPDPGGRYARIEEHDLGRFCDLVTDFGLDVYVAFLDADTNALLMYRGPAAGGGVIEVVDPGGRGLRRLVGADPSLGFDPGGRPVAVYQDATENDVLLAVRNPEGWIETPLTVASAGALGFYNSLVMVGAEAVVGTLELRTTSGGRGAHRLHVFRQALPRF